MLTLPLVAAMLVPCAGPTLGTLGRIGLSMLVWWLTHGTTFVPITYC
jgi:hypothetical protein